MKKPIYKSKYQTKMKKYILLTVTMFLLISCGSDNLSNSKAEDIVAKCLEANPEKRTASFRIGKASFSKREGDQELLQKYLKLADEDYLEMELIKETTKGWAKGTKEYAIKLKEKSLEYMEEVPEKNGNATAKSFQYKVDEVLEVHETPATNTAEVKVNFKAVDITPFAILSRKDPTEFWVKKLKFSKTSNGWKYCDEF